MQYVELQIRTATHQHTRAIAAETNIEQKKMEWWKINLHVARTHTDIHAATNKTTAQQTTTTTTTQQQQQTTTTTNKQQQQQQQQQQTTTTNDNNKQQQQQQQQQQLCIFRCPGTAIRRVQFLKVNPTISHKDHEVCPSSIGTAPSSSSHPYPQDFVQPMPDHDCQSTTHSPNCRRWTQAHEGTCSDLQQPS